jgi:predicted O-methyltransferase YrrM
MRIPLDSLDPLVAEVGYGHLGRGGQLGYEEKVVSVAGRRYVSALSTHAPARVVFDLSRHRGAIFQCEVALNDDAPAGSSHADFTVLADGRVVAEQRRVRAGEPPRPLVGQCSGAGLLELRVTTSRWDFCHAVWLEPRVEGTDGQPVPAPAVVTDPLQRADIEVPGLAPLARAVVTVASAGFENWVDDLFASIHAYGNVPDAQLVLFCLGPSPELVAVAARHGALPVMCRPRRRLNPSSKAVLYSAARVIPAEHLVCLDADMLVLDDLSPLFGALSACRPEAVLVCREGNHPGIADLRTALDVAYGGGPDPPFFSRRGPRAHYPLVVNDGLFAGSRPALLALEDAVRRLPGAVAWIDERRNIGWRNQFVLNAALAELDCGVELDPAWNVQLHAQDVEVDLAGERPRVRWQGRPVRVLHFSGHGKHKEPELRGALRAPPDPPAAPARADAFGEVSRALRAWTGRRGVGAGLRWSMFGTADGQSARLPDPVAFPPLRLLHSLVLANGCVRVLETGTAQGISAGCLAAAVAHRSGAAVVSFDPTPWPESERFWDLLPEELRSVIDQRPVGAVEGMAAELAAGKRYHAAFLDSIHTEEQVWAEFELAAQLVVEGGLILAHDARLPSGTVDRALDRIAAAGWPVTVLMAAVEGVPEDDGLGLAVVENRRSPGGPISAREPPP